MLRALKAGAQALKGLEPRMLIPSFIIHIMHDSPRHCFVWGTRHTDANISA